MSGITTGTALAIASVASVAVAAAGTVMQIQQSKSAAKAAGRAAEANFNAQNAELTRQQNETNRLAAQDKSDVVRRADAELGTLRVAGAEAGASNSSFLRMVNELGYVEGTDLSRIEGNRKASNDSLQSAKEAAKAGAQNQATLAYNQSQSNISQAAIGFAGTALQIGTNYVSNKAMLANATNKRTVNANGP